MSEDELKAHEQWATSSDGENPWDGVENGARRVLALVAEVRRLRRVAAIAAIDDACARIAEALR